MNGRAVAGKQLRNNIKCYLQGNDGLPGSRGTKGDSGEKVRNKKYLNKKELFLHCKALECSAYQVDNFNCASLPYKGMAGEAGLPGMPGGNGDAVSNQWKLVILINFACLLASVC